MNAHLTGKQATPDQPGIFYEAVWSRTVAKNIDEQSSRQFGIDALTLMEEAGTAVANYVLDHYPADHNILVLAGSGNNGGDAQVAARVLLQAGRTVTVFAANDSAQMTELHRYLEQHSNIVVIDGILGIGLKGSLREGPARETLTTVAAGLKRGDSRVIAIDVPSGLDCDDGSSTDIPLPADVTITFGAAKPALLLSPARDRCGDIIVHPLGFAPPAITASVAADFYLAALQAAPLLAYQPWQRLSPSAHKYDRGHVLVIGGSDGKLGAPVLSGLAALRGGCGWSSIALPTPAWREPDPAWPLELTFEDFFVGGTLDVKALKHFLATRQVRAVVIGPGMMTSPLSPALLAMLAEQQQQTQLGLVIDGGALQDFLTLTRDTKFAAERTVITPHPGEWRRLTTPSPSPPTSMNDLPEVHAILRGAGVTAIYKSATPIIIPAAVREPSAFIATQGGTTLARAGSGDVLAGIIAAHLAIGEPAARACARSYMVMAAAATLAADELGEHAVLASDIIQRLGRIA